MYTPNELAEMAREERQALEAANNSGSEVQVRGAQNRLGAIYLELEILVPSPEERKQLLDL